MKSIDEMVTLDWLRLLYGLVWRFILLMGLIGITAEVIGEKRIERMSAATQQWFADQSAVVEKWIADGRR